MMIGKLNKFFELHGKLLTEAEYMSMGSVPYRIGTIKKYLRSWPSMLAYITTVYPHWNTPVKVEEPSEEVKSSYTKKKEKETFDEENI